MNKSQFYLSECTQAASKSPMCFKLGAVMVKGGKVISSGYNHHRPHYDGAEVHTHGHRKPVSMHAEMHAIFSLTGMSPSFKKQVQGVERRVPQRGAACRIPKGPKGSQRPGRAAANEQSTIPKGCVASERCLSGAWMQQTVSEVEEEQEFEAGLDLPSSEALTVERQQQQWRSEWKRELWQEQSSAAIPAC